MHLNRSIPLLFATPSASGTRRAITYSILILAVTIFFYLAADKWPSVPFFGAMTVIIGMHGYIALTTSNANLLYIFRYFLVWVLIFGTAFVWFAYSGEVFVAPFGLEFQTAENTRLLVTAGVFALCGSLIGWHVSFLNFRYQRYPGFYLSTRHRRQLRQVGVFLAFGFALLYVWKSGGIVGGSKTYADGQAGFDIVFGVFNVFQYIGISLLLLAGIGNGYIRPTHLLIAVGTLTLGMLVGSRADYLPQTFLILMVIYNRQVAEALSKHQYVRMIKWAVWAVALVFLGYFSASFIAIWRNGVNPVEAITVLLESERGLLINEVFGHKMLFLETGNMMLGGAYSAIAQVQEGITGYLWGESYINYLLIAPPAFLGLPRPLGLEWMTDINGTVMSLGGIFEVAEAYWNFGLLGCFFISFFISYAFGWILKRGLKYNNYFYLIWYLVYGFMGFRAIWYQNFSYFRIMTVMLVIYMAALFSFRWFVVNRNRPRYYVQKLDNVLPGVQV